ncbi:MAG: GUN4 domain-containing protein [Thermosynechococcaceae cyanobacterium]
MAESDWAIIIGINQYDFLPTDDHLKYAVNDAVKVRQFLCEQAKFPQENVLLCCDSTPGASPQQRPSRNGLRHLLKNEIQRAKGAHNFWFFYAGHGIVHEHQDFLLPCDGNPRDLEQTAIPISFVTDCLRDCGADNVVLVMDMCRNRTRGADEGSRDIGEAMGEQTQQIAKEQGIVTLFSCSRGERSYEIGDLGQGAFTYALLEGLKQNTTPRALEQYLTQRVPALNLQYGKKIQTPRVIPEPGLKYDRPLLLSCASPADIQQLAVEARDAELEEQDYEKAQALWWQVIEADRSTQSDRAKARKAINRISNITAGAHEQRLVEEERNKEAERQRELERQQELERQRQEQLKKEAAVKRKQVEEQERQRQEAEELKRQQTEAERLRQEELERQRRELPSEKGIDYTKLRDLLNAQDWKAADKETADRMCEMCEFLGRQEDLDPLLIFMLNNDFENLPCADLSTIDQLWVKHSQGQFGFSVQKKIWQECENRFKFSETVGWMKEIRILEGSKAWKSENEITFDKSAPKGHLPWLERIFVGPEGWDQVGVFFSRVKTCKL